MTKIVILCVWIAAIPVGYIACRWSIRSTFTTWTRLDRLYAIVGAMCFGPMMPVMAVLVVLLTKLDLSDWAARTPGGDS